VTYPEFENLALGDVVTVEGFHNEFTVIGVARAAAEPSRIVVGGFSIRFEIQALDARKVTLVRKVGANVSQS
jgi:hypothetical protein